MDRGSRDRSSGRWPRGALARDITRVLIAKAVLIAAIYFAFFSNPPGAHLDQQDVAAAVLGPPARAETLRRADREEDMPHSVIDGNPR